MRIVTDQPLTDEASTAMALTGEGRADQPALDQAPTDEGPADHTAADEASADDALPGAALTGEPLTVQLKQAAAAVALIGSGAAGYAALNDADLLESQTQLGLIRRQYDTHAAWAAGEIARRSTREMSFNGLAQRNGFLSPESLIQSATGGTRAEAAKLVAVGTLMTQTEATEAFLDQQQTDPDIPLTEQQQADLAALAGLAAPWLAVVAGAVRAGTLSVDAAEAIRKGLGDIDPGVPAGKLAAAAAFLLGEAASLNADQLLRRARRLRDELDADGIARREKTQRDARSFRIWRQPDGMYRISALLPPEDGRLVELIIDGATSPRRGGPRFVDPRTQARADALRDDERSTEQIAADTILALLQIGSNADPNTVFFGRRPAVRVIVTEHDLAHTIPGPAFRNPAGQIPVGQNRVGQNLVGQNVAGQNPIGQNPIGQNLAGQNAAGQNRAGQNPTGQNPVGQNPTGQNRVGQHPIGQNPVGQNPAGQNPIGQNLVGQNPAGQNPIGQNLAGQNLAGQNLAGQNPADANRASHVAGSPAGPQTSTSKSLSGSAPNGSTGDGIPREGLLPPGHGQIEGHPDPVSMETVHRLLCSGITGVQFDDDGQCVNVGRDQRLFTARQRVGLATRDGGCRWIGCDKPASWTEAHHIDEWKADHGRTDVADGILLCKAHHLMLHNNGWQIRRTGADYWLLPPVTLDATQTPIPMPSKSPLMLHLFPPKHPAPQSARRPANHPAEQTG